MEYPYRKQCLRCGQIATELVNKGVFQFKWKYYKEEFLGYTLAAGLPYGKLFLSSSEDRHIVKTICDEYSFYNVKIEDGVYLNVNSLNFITLEFTSNKDVVRFINKYKMDIDLWCFDNDIKDLQDRKKVWMPNVQQMRRD